MSKIIPIQNLDASADLPSDRTIHAVVTLLWPYSSSTGQCAFLLSERDFRLRAKGGQIRIKFSGSAARAIAEKRPGIGDEVILELEHGEWVRDEEGVAVQVPGKSVGELQFGRGVSLRVQKEGAEDVEINVTDDSVDEAEEEASENGEAPMKPASPVTNFRSSIGAPGGAAIYSSPAYMRKAAKFSYLDGISRLFEDEWENQDLPRKKARTSLEDVKNWKVVSRTPSPVRSPQQLAVQDDQEMAEADIDNGHQGEETRLDSPSSAPASSPVATATRHAEQSSPTPAPQQRQDATVSPELADEAQTSLLDAIATSPITSQRPLTAQPAASFPPRLQFPSASPTPERNQLKEESAQPNDPITPRLAPLSSTTLPSTTPQISPLATKNPFGAGANAGSDPVKAAGNVPETGGTSNNVREEVSTQLAIQRSQDQHLLFTDSGEPANEQDEGAGLWQSDALAEEDDFSEEEPDEAMGVYDNDNVAMNEEDAEEVFEADELEGEAPSDDDTNEDPEMYRDTLGDPEESTSQQPSFAPASSLLQATETPMKAATPAAAFATIPTTTPFKAASFSFDHALPSTETTPLAKPTDTPKRTPQSARDRVMKRTFSSLFGIKGTPSPEKEDPPQNSSFANVGQSSPLHDQARTEEAVLIGSPPFQSQQVELSQPTVPEASTNQRKDVPNLDGSDDRNEEVMQEEDTTNQAIMANEGTSLSSEDLAAQHDQELQREASVEDNIHTGEQLAEVIDVESSPEDEAQTEHNTEYIRERDQTPEMSVSALKPQQRAPVQASAPILDASVHSDDEDVILVDEHTVAVEDEGDYVERGEESGQEETAGDKNEAVDTGLSVHDEEDRMEEGPSVDGNRPEPILLDSPEQEPQVPRPSAPQEVQIADPMETEPEPKSQTHEIASIVAIPQHDPFAADAPVRESESPRAISPLPVQVEDSAATEPEQQEQNQSESLQIFEGLQDIAEVEDLRDDMHMGEVERQPEVRSSLKESPLRENVGADPLVTPSVEPILAEREVRETSQADTEMLDMHQQEREMSEASFQSQVAAQSQAVPGTADKQDIPVLDGSSRPASSHAMEDFSPVALGTLPQRLSDVVSQESAAKRSQELEEHDEMEAEEINQEVQELPSASRGADEEVSAAEDREQTPSCTVQQTTVIDLLSSSPAAENFSPVKLAQSTEEENPASQQPFERTEDDIEDGNNITTQQQQSDLGESASQQDADALDSQLRSADAIEERVSSIVIETVEKTETDQGQSKEAAMGENDESARPRLPLSPSLTQASKVEARLSQANMNVAQAAVMQPTPPLTSQLQPSAQLSSDLRPQQKQTTQNSEAIPRQQEQADMETRPEIQPTTPARKSFRSRLSNVPDVISAWFSPKRSSIAVQEADAEQPEEVEKPAAPTVDVQQNILKRRKSASGLSTAHAYFTSLASLDQHLNPSSQQAGAVDVLAVVTDFTQEPQRAKGGPRDYYTICHITDLSVSSSSRVRFEVFRPWKAVLPAADVGDVILLRAFAVKSKKRQPYLLSTDTSSWCVWRFAEHSKAMGRTGSSTEGEKPVWARRMSVGEVREEVKGPPVEYGTTEKEQAWVLRNWWLETHGESQEGTAGEEVVDAAGEDEDAA